MSNLELLQSMTFDFFGSGGKKIEMENLLATKDAIFLDVRSSQERESLQITLEQHIRIAPSNHDAITSQLLPGKLYKAIGDRKIEQERQ